MKRGKNGYWTGGQHQARPRENHAPKKRVRSNGEIKCGRTGGGGPSPLPKKIPL